MIKIILIIASSILMLGGLLSIFLPFIPGLPIVWLGLFIYAIGTGFHQISIPVVAGFFVLTVMTLAVDFFAPYLGIRKYKASIYSILGSFLGFIIGAIFFNIIGAIIGPFIGAFLGELIAKGNLRQGYQALMGAIAGAVIGTLLKVVIALIMIGYFIFSFF